MKTITTTLDSTGGYDTTWREIGVSDYTDAVISLKGTWSGPVSFWGDNKPTAGSTLMAVQDISTTNWTTAVTYESGASPSENTFVARVPIAGLTRIGIWGDTFNYSGFGTFVSVSPVEVTVTLVSNTNAR